MELFLYSSFFLDSRLVVPGNGLGSRRDLARA